MSRLLRSLLLCSCLFLLHGCDQPPAENAANQKANATHATGANATTTDAGNEAGSATNSTLPLGEAENALPPVRLDGVGVLTPAQAQPGLQKLHGTWHGNATQTLALPPNAHLAELPAMEQDGLTTLLNLASLTVDASTGRAIMGLARHELEASVTAQDITDKGLTLHYATQNGTQALQVQFLNANTITLTAPPAPGSNSTFPLLLQRKQ